MKKKLFLLIIFNIILCTIIFIVGYKVGLNQSQTSNKISNSLEELVTSSSIMIVGNTDENTNNNYYYKDMSETFNIIINQHIREKLYSKYGDIDEFAVKSINEYNSIYMISNKTDIEHQIESIEIQKECLKILAEQISDIYNFKVYVLDAPSNSLKKWYSLIVHM